MKISVVFPALNEEEGIGRALDEVPVKELAKKGYEVELVVVDGGSVDNTVKIATDHGAKVIHSETGYGRQYKRAFSMIDGDIIITGDSDGSYPLEYSASLVEELLNKNLDFLSTNRFANLEEGSMSVMHKFGNNMLTLLARILFGVSFKDSQSGMWVFKRKILEKMNLISNGMPFSEELKIEAFRKFKSAETPITYRKRIGKVKLNTIKDGAENILFLLYKRLVIR